MRKTLLAALSAAAILAAAPSVSAAARTVPVTVDGAAVEGASYVERGVTQTPLRSLCALLGDYQVYWDGTQAVAQSGAARITARPGEAAVTVNGVRHAAAAAVFIQDGRTYVPLRTLCEALECAVAWDASLGGAAVTTPGAAAVSAGDLYWLSRIISAESQGEPLTGQIAVGNVVMNRVASEEFPDTVREVVFDRTDGVQFEPVANGTVYHEPTAQSVAAARAVLAGENTVGRCLYFYAPALSQGTWINANRTYYATIGCHRFYL